MVETRGFLINALGLVTVPGWFFTFAAWWHPVVFAWHMQMAMLVIAACLVFHEMLHVAAIRLVAPQVSVRYTLRGVNPAVRIEGQLSTSARIVFLLTPFVTITLLLWAITIALPAAAVTCVIVAATNAASSTADLWRCGEVVAEAWRRRDIPYYEGDPPAASDRTV